MENNFFEIKAKYEKTGENGKSKVVTESYIVSAVSLSDSETVITKELTPYISGEFLAVSSKFANISEVIGQEAGDRWFLCKVSFISVNEETGKEKRNNHNMLIQADNVPDAYHNLYAHLSDTMSDYEIPSVSESPIMGVFSKEINGD